MKFQEKCDAIIALISERAAQSSWGIKAIGWDKNWIRIRQSDSNKTKEKPLDFVKWRAIKRAIPSAIKGDK